MIRRHELSNAEREFVRPAVATRGIAGAEAAGRPQGLNGIVWKFRPGTAWREVPGRCGPRATPHTRFRRWAADGAFQRMLRTAQVKADTAGDVEFDAVVRIDTPGEADHFATAASCSTCCTACFADAPSIHCI
ncbi:transposase [Streptomyces sp. NPDC059256]|uniref:transposase n=1 Tax=unclassified Streptomyces TaxID=2593676 RepID=UPI0036B871FC